jgi:hypothetical protein
VTDDPHRDGKIPRLEFTLNFMADGRPIVSTQRAQRQPPAIDAIEPPNENRQLGSRQDIPNDLEIVVVCSSRHPSLPNLLHSGLLRLRVRV